MKKLLTVALIFLTLILTGCKTVYDDYGRILKKPIPFKISICDTEVYAIHRPKEVEMRKNKSLIETEEIKPKSVVAIISAITAIGRIFSDCYKWASKAREIGAIHECYWGTWMFKLVTIEWGWDKYYLESKKLLTEQHEKFTGRP